MNLKKKKKICAMMGIAIAGIAAFNIFDIDIKITLKENDHQLLAMYLEDESGDYALSSDTKFPTDGYVLNLEKSFCKNGGVLSQNPSTKAIALSTSSKDECTLYFDINIEKNPLLNVIMDKTNSIAVTEYTSGNQTEMYTFNHEATEQTGALTDYRYIGSNPNNWIKYNDEDWRIIGVFTVEKENGKTEQLIKIIRNESIGALRWDSSVVNNWSTSSLHTILNGDYYKQSGSYAATSLIKGLSEKARNQIENVKWYLAGASSEGVGGAQYYNAERSTTVYTGYVTNIIQTVGLMYPSDYLYTYANGVDEICYESGRSCQESYGANPSTSWLFNNVAQHMQTPSTNISYASVAVAQNGIVSVTNVYGQQSVRPVVYLKSDIQIIGGDGSSSKPYNLE